MRFCSTGVWGKKFWKWAEYENQDNVLILSSCSWSCRPLFTYLPIKGNDTLTATAHKLWLTQYTLQIVWEVCAQRILQEVFFCIAKGKYFQHNNFTESWVGKYLATSCSIFRSVSQSSAASPPIDIHFSRQLRQVSVETFYLPVVRGPGWYGRSQQATDMTFNSIGKHTNP